MDLLTHHINGYEIAEIISGELIIKSAEDGVDLLGNVYYQGFDRLILQHHHIVPDFFDLKTGIAGEILQKFSNYRVRLAIVGEFKNRNSKSLNDFILESNTNRHINLVETVDEALVKLGT